MSLGKAVKVSFLFSYRCWQAISARAMASHRPCTFSVIFVVCCGLLVIAVAIPQTSRSERNSTDTFRRVTRDRRRYCGKALTDTLAMVCTSYPSPWRKKSVPTSDEDSFEGSYREQLVAEIKQDVEELEQLAPEMFNDKPPLFYPFYPRAYWQASDDSMDTHPRVRRQIVDECCRKSCTLKTLKQYCAD
ncbi:probable insulin-like peptide 2 isoform X2 [Wyeomyia smithii]|uniref:probable insulin-like peptide 2 isoform X2 n=1 Tax=Wyeomyia smithii TaxID=174621 RepID=UPI002467B105|nr:probable insulin-like peptide 2 isoform X2 [Wyeomyia smithii]